MTTAVIVDAHAGWDVEVKTDTGGGAPESVQTEIVEKNTKRTFYIHSSMSIVGIKEIPNKAA